MHIVHLIQSAPRLYGAERCALLELRALRAAGHDARAVVLHETRMGAGAEVLPAALAAAGVPVTRVIAPGQVSPGLLRGLHAALRGLPRPAVVHSHGLKTDI